MDASAIVSVVTMQEPTIVVIGQDTIDTSRGPLVLGEYVRLPVVEAIKLHHAQKVLFADWQEQQLSDLPDKPKRGRYLRRDLRADL